MEQAGRYHDGSVTVRVSCSALLFDLDGVLVHSAQSVERSWHTWALRHGIDPAVVADAARGRRTVDTIRQVAPHLSASAAAAQLESEQAADIGDVISGRGAAELVRVLRVGEWAVVTSGTAVLARARLRAARLPAPTVLVTGDEVIAGKPDPEGYLLGASRLGVPAKSCVVLEDADAGVEAAKSAGMRVIGLTNDGDGIQVDRADLVVASCADVHIVTGTPGVPGDGIHLDVVTSGR